MALTFLQKFLNECCTESEERDESGQRFVVTTSTLEDWLHRGDHPILAPMSLYVYAMWVFRVEKPGRIGASRPTRPRFIDVEFAPHYALCNTHSQRIASECRVPLFEGFTMPPTMVDSETAALYKQILLRPLEVSAGEEPEDVRLVRAFAPLCSVRPTSTQSRSAAGATAFTQNWVAFAATQGRLALEVRRRHQRPGGEYGRGLRWLGASGPRG